MPYYAEKFLRKAHDMAVEAAKFERESAKLAKEEAKEREAREAQEAADKAAMNAAIFARDADAEDRYTYEEVTDVGPSKKREEGGEDEEEEIKLTVTRVIELIRAHLRSLPLKFRTVNSDMQL